MISIASLALRFWPFLALGGLWLWMTAAKHIAVSQAVSATKAQQIEICNDRVASVAARHNRHVREKIKRADRVRLKRLTPAELSLQCKADPNCRQDGE